MTFGRWRVLALQGRSSRNQAMWDCKCECGSRAVIRGSSLTTGNSTSCGCYRDERLGASQRTHGMAETKPWYVWSHMLQRCQSPTNPAYRHYGGRGITVCERWQTFENFYTDMGDPPDGMSIDRIDVNGNYEPSNCRWATPTEQSNNRRSNTYLTAFGKSQTIAQWSRETGIKQPTICVRLARGASHEEALK